MQKSDQQKDLEYGFKIDEIEELLYLKARNARPEGSHHTWGHHLHQGNQTWVGLDPQTLQTPYAEIAHGLNLLSPSPGMRLVDLGAGYGRVGLVLSELYPAVSFLGLEYVQERVLEGQRVFKSVGLSESGLREADLTAKDFVLPVADIYFLYDYGNVRDIRATLKQMERVADDKHFRVMARGKGVRGLIDYEFPWLSQVHPPHHEENFSLYFTASEDSYSQGVSEDL